MTLDCTKSVDKMGGVHEKRRVLLAGANARLHRDRRRWAGTELIVGGIRCHGLRERQGSDRYRGYRAGQATVCVVADEETNFQSRLEEEGIHEKILKVPHRPQHRHLSHPQRTKTNLTLLI